MLIRRASPASESSVMATLAVRTERQSRVIGICSPRQVVLVAGRAICRRAAELITIAVLMAGFTVGHGMNASKRKAPIGMLLEQVYLRMPIACNVAVLAVQT